MLIIQVIHYFERFFVPNVDGKSDSLSSVKMLPKHTAPSYPWPGEHGDTSSHLNTGQDKVCLP